MKTALQRILSSILLGASVLFTACTSNISPDVADKQLTSGTFDFTLDATMGELETISDDDTKAASVISVVRLNWEAGSEVSAINLTTGKALGGSLTADKTGTVTTFSGTLTGTVNNGDKIAFIYPSQGYTTEQNYTPINIDLSRQSGNSNSGVPICVYSVVTAGSGTFDKASASFKFLMSYLQMNLTGLEANSVINEVSVDNIGCGMTLGITADGITATPVQGTITMTPPSTYKVKSDGTRSFYMSFAESPAVTKRTVTADTANETKACDWTGNQLNVSTSYTSTLASFRKVITSTHDGDVVVLQEGIEGLDLVIMGDGFIQEDINDGTYEDIMRQAYDEFFGVEPFTSLKDDFSVYYVVAVSDTRVNATNTGLNGATNNPESRTKFSSSFTENSTSITGNTSTAREYAKMAFKTNANARIENATIVVMVNQACHAGTCHTSYYPSSHYDYGESSSVSFCALGATAADRVAIMRHEICGHGFGKLADEYYYNTSSISVNYPGLENLHNIGLDRNIDRFIDSDLYSQLGGAYELTTTSNVYWHDLFGTANNYESSSVESLGVFKGAYTYSFGYCRPTQDSNKSIMYTNGPFNAPSRRAIYYRYLHLSGQISTNQFGTAEELSRFLAWDATILPRIQASISSNVNGNYVEQQYLPLASPVLEAGEWIDGKFVRLP